MRPRKLHIEGFTCFRAPVDIDFTGLDVFVISGATGAGKTTIIDAICYALYGKVPRDTRVSDMISRDASSMSVQLEFDAGGRRYRVHRGVNVTRTTVKKTGAERIARDISPVQFESRDGDEWVPLADRVADVERAIVDAVGLDFDSFTRCVLLPQGQFAEFLAGDRAQRRALLIDLLDIGIYDRVMRAANERAKTLNTQVAERERQLRDDYADATEEALAAARDQLTHAKPRLAQAQEQRAALQEAHTHATTAAAAYKGEIDRRQQIKTSEAELQRAEKEAAGATKKLAELEKTAAAAEAALKESAYDSALHASLGKASALAAHFERARDSAAKAVAAVGDGESVKEAEVRALDAAAEREAARTAVAAAQAALEEAQRHDSAAYLRGGLRAGDPCPVCGGKVGKLPRGEKLVFDTVRKQLDSAQKAEAKAGDASQRAQTAAALARKEFDAAQLAARDAAASVEQAESDLNSALPKGINPDPAQIASALTDQERARRAHDGLAESARNATTALQAHRDSMAESGQRIAALRREIELLQTQIDQAVEQRRAEAARVREIAAAWRWPQIEELIEDNKSPAAALKTMLDGAQDESEAITRAIAKLEADEERIEKAITRASALRDELVAMKTSWQLSRDLGTLLRADNFQEFVICEAMEALAVAASDHLKTLYDRYAIAVDGSEFVVVDGWHGGQRRPAKTLSGGETFVASLALALALSERLPELRSSAGATLESLFLDEGFGTLDAETLDDVIAVLEGLRSQERMVGIITHVPDLAQRVEHRILVRASPEGSAVETSA